MAGHNYHELSRKEIGEQKFIVVSKRTDGKYSVAQQVIAEIEGNSLHLFLKNAIVVDGSGLRALGQAITEAVDSEV